MSGKNSDRQDVVDLQCKAEAHLYVAVAKADGIVSKNEKASTGHIAARSQKLYDVIDINSDISKQIAGCVASILADPLYTSWNSDDHADEALSLFRKAAASGNWSVSLSSLKHEQGLMDVALIDEYVFAESAAVKKIIRRLEKELSVYR